MRNDVAYPEMLAAAEAAINGEGD